MTFYVYILANHKRMIYIGSTNDLQRRLFEHKLKLVKGFTEKYSVSSLVYFETYDCRETALKREKQLKGWVRRRKVELIEESNPTWKDMGFRFIYPEQQAQRLLEAIRGKNVGGVELLEILYRPMNRPTKDLAPKRKSHKPIQEQ